MDSDSKVEFVYYHPDWSPTGGKPIWLLRLEGEITTLEEYDYKLRLYYFCPGCGVPCYRNPTKKEVQRSGRKMFFGHFSGYDDIPCSLRTKQGVRREYLSEREKQRAVDEGQLTVIKKWRDIPDEIEALRKSVGIYKGTAEDDNSLISEAVINRYIGEEWQSPRESGSLFLIGREIEKYLGQDIQLPGFSKPQPFRDVFIHAYEIDKEKPNIPKIFWGAIDSVFLESEDLVVKFRYENHNVIFHIPQQIANRRYWTPENLQGKLVMISGKIESSRNRYSEKHNITRLKNIWEIYVEQWGQAAIITSKYAKNLQLKDGRCWQEVLSLQEDCIHNESGKQWQSRRQSESSSSTEFIEPKSPKFRERLSEFLRNNRATIQSLRQLVEETGRTEKDAQSGTE